VRLILVRHGAAVPKSQDPTRPLSPEGVASVQRMGQYLRRVPELDIGAIWYSPKLRARQTAEWIARELGFSGPMSVEPALEPDADVMDTVRAIDRVARSLMLVGHLPHLNLLASYLVCGQADAEIFAFAPAAVLCLERTSHRVWKVVWFLHPDMVP